ncbi:ABC transporter permease [Patescibacteria group bacterium]|nr:ABC transporter permease [Patescibacteria group bacterium]
MRNIQIGLLLGLRQIQRANVWTNVLIIFVMTLTFLNLIAVSGLLVGLIAGSERAFREQSLGDILVSAKADEKTILGSEALAREIATYPDVSSFTVRYIESASVEANYSERRDLRGERDVVSTRIRGIDPEVENTTTGLAQRIVEGSYLSPDDEGKILVGSLTLDRYASGFGDAFDTLGDVQIGDKVRVSVGNTSKEFTVKGILQSKVEDVSMGMFIPEKEFRRIFNRFDRNADQISIRLKPGVDENTVKKFMVAGGMSQYAKIETFTEGTPKFLTDIKNTFNLLGTFIGSIGLVVASITIFIIIFINALSRRRHIGILKAVGIDKRVIELAYVTQAAFYAFTGSLLGALITYGFLIPFFDANPINFPFSDGILLVETSSALIRTGILFVITLAAGFVPAWLIARQNTLNAILGR